MRLHALSLLLGATLMNACGGSDAPPAADQAGGDPAPVVNSGDAVMQPITGTIHTVNMVMDAQGITRYDPATITIKTGDGVKFVMVSGAPHNIAFNEADVPADVKPQLAANMPSPADNPKINAIASPILVADGAEYTISFAGIRPGSYKFTCTPHMAMNMTGTVIVTQ